LIKIRLGFIENRIIIRLGFVKIYYFAGVIINDNKWKSI